jgi:hypothetical protein
VTGTILEKTGIEFAKESRRESLPPSPVISDTRVIETRRVGNEAKQALPGEDAAPKSALDAAGRRAEESSLLG